MDESTSARGELQTHPCKLERVQLSSVRMEPEVMALIDGHSVRKHSKLAMLGVATGLWLADATARAAAGGGYCDEGERVEMSDPVVTLVEG